MAVGVDAGEARGLSSGVSINLEATMAMKPILRVARVVSVVYHWRGTDGEWGLEH